MTAKLKNTEAAWESIKKGTFVEDYAHDFRESIQKTIETAEKKTPLNTLGWLFASQSREDWKAMTNQDIQEGRHEGDHQTSNRRRFV
jgi:hypothetical protein